MMRFHPSDVDSTGELRDPPRLTEDLGLSDAARGLLLSPPPVKPLDAATAARVRAAVLQSPAGLAATKPFVKPSPSTIARLKLGAVAGAAALFGAGAMTVASGYFGSQTRSTSLDESRGVFVSGDERGSIVGEDGADLRPGAIGLAPPHAWQPSARRPDTARGSSNATDPSERTSLLDGVNVDGRGEGTNAHRSGSLGAVTGAPHAEAGPASGARSSVGPASPRVLSVDDLQPLKDATAFGSSPGTRTTAAVKVRPEFRKIASASVGPAAKKGNRRAPMGSNLEEETRLLEEARGKLGRDPEAALALALTHQTRFRRGQLLEQRRMIHLEALLRLGRDDEALNLAKSIGNSIYQARARALLSKYGI